MAIDRFEVLSALVRRRFPRFRVKNRDKTWLGLVFRLLSKVTRQDYSSFTTTIFSTIYVGSDWDLSTSDEKYQTLRHEMIHIEQFHRFPLGPWAWPVNHLLMIVCYTLLLPLVWTFRARFERAGYEQTLLVEHELRGPVSQSRMEHNARWIAETFGGAAYFFMWRRQPAYDWAMETQQRIAQGLITNPRDRVEEMRVVPASPRPAA